MENTFVLPDDIAAAYEEEVAGAHDQLETMISPSLNALRPYGSQLRSIVDQPEYAAVRNVILMLLVLVGMPDLAAQDSGMDAFLSDPDAIKREIAIAAKTFLESGIEWLETVGEILQKWGALAGVGALAYRWYRAGRKLAIETGERLVEGGRVNLGRIEEHPTTLGHDGNGNWTMGINAIQEPGTYLLDDVLNNMQPKQRNVVRDAIRAKFKGEIKGKRSIEQGYSIFLDLPADAQAEFMSALRRTTTNAAGAQNAMLQEAGDVNTNAPGIVVIPALEPGIAECEEDGCATAQWVGTKSQQEQNPETRTTIMLRRIEIGESQLYEFTNLLAEYSWDGTNVGTAQNGTPGRTMLQAIANFDQGALVALMNGEVPGINNLNLPRRGIDQARIVALCQGRIELDRVRQMEINREHYEAEVTQFTGSKVPGAAGKLAEAKAELAKIAEEEGARVVVGRPMAA